MEHSRLISRSESAPQDISWPIKKKNVCVCVCAGGGRVLTYPLDGWGGASGGGAAQLCPLALLERQHGGVDRGHRLGAFHS